MKESPNVFSALQTDLRAIVNGSPVAAYSISNFGGVSLTSRGSASSTTAGYAQITPAAGQTAPGRRNIRLSREQYSRDRSRRAGIARRPADPDLRRSQQYGQHRSRDRQPEPGACQTPSIFRMICTTSEMEA